MKKKELILLKNKRFDRPFTDFLLLATLLILLSYDVLLSLKSFPITEGWWETYAWLDGNDNIFNKFQMKMGPLNVELTKGLMNLFHEKLFYLRMVYSCIHLVSIFLLYKALESIYTRVSSLIGTVFAVVLYVWNPVYIPKDYHTVVELNAVVAFYIFVCFVLHRKIFYYLILAFVLGILFILKQNIAVFFGLPIFLLSYSLLLKDNDGYEFSKHGILFGISGLLLLIIPSLIYSVFFGFEWLSIYIANDSKGSLPKILLRFLTSKQDFFVTALAVIFCAAAFFVKSNFEFISKKLDVVFGFVLLFAICLIVYPFSFIPFLALCLSWVCLRSCIFKESSHVTYNSPVFAFGLLYTYAGTLTAGYNVVSMEFLFALVVAEFSSIIIARESLFSNIAIKSLPFLLLISLLYKTVALPSYNWWGLSLPPIFSSDYGSVDNELLEYISVDTFTRNTIEETSRVLREHPEATFLSTPSIPLLYLLNKKYPLVPPVSWFDVSSTESGRHIANDIQNGKFDIIAWLKPPEEVFVGHYKLIGRDPGNYYIDQQLMGLLESGLYEVIYTDTPYDKHAQTRSIRNSITATLPILTEFDITNIKTYCTSIKTGCNFDSSSRAITFKNSYSFIEFIKQNKVICESSKYIFYILQKKTP